MSNRCSVCANVTNQALVDAMLAKGLSAVFISHELGKLGIELNDGPINNHRKHYIVPIAPDAAKNPKDLAILVRDRTIKAMEDGRLEPTIKDGLTAQGLLDRRAEKVDDRNTMLQLARLLSGQLNPEALLAPDSVVVIEGTARDVSADASS